MLGAMQAGTGLRIGPYSHRQEGPDRHVDTVNLQSELQAMQPSGNPVDRHAPPEDTIALFRSLFRERDDVYPRRFETERMGVE